MPDLVHSLATNCKLYQTITAGEPEGLNTQGCESKFSGVQTCPSHYLCDQSSSRHQLNSHSATQQFYSKYNLQVTCQVPKSLLLDCTNSQLNALQNFIINFFNVHSHIVYPRIRSLHFLKNASVFVTFPISSNVVSAGWSLQLIRSNLSGYC
jgi:hypothetical protein